MVNHKYSRELGLWDLEHSKIVLPFDGHARQSKLMHAQVNTKHKKYMELWICIIKQKISNQSRALSIMGRSGAERIAKYVSDGNEENVNYCYYSISSSYWRKELYSLANRLLYHNIY